MIKIIIINGPNLNLLGIREPQIYGNLSFEKFLETLKLEFNHIQIDYFQSNFEGEIIEKIHQLDKSYNSLIINPGGLTHTSVSIADALKCVKFPKIEVHISNIDGREDFRKKSITIHGCDGMISGLGLDSYKLAIEHIIETYYD